MIANRPVMKAEIPETIPASVVRAKAGLAAISSKIVRPAGTDLYNVFVNDVPMKNNIGIAMMSLTDHLPNEVFGITLQGGFVILSSSRIRKQYIRLILSILHTMRNKYQDAICFTSQGQPFWF